MREVHCAHWAGLMGASSPAGSDANQSDAIDGLLDILCGCGLWHICVIITFLRYVPLWNNNVHCVEISLSWRLNHKSDALDV